MQFHLQKYDLKNNSEFFILISNNSDETTHTHQKKENNSSFLSREQHLENRRLDSVSNS